VTSPQAAALSDILHILERRHHTANVLIFPAQVQGDTAAIEVGAGIRYFNQTGCVDVIIVARGGGSVEDLAAFNHEGLARTIAASKIAVISAVGHETDFTIVDFVADLRAPTPSAAAELVIRSRQEIDEQAERLHQRLARAVRYRLLMARQALTERAQHGAFARMRGVINQGHQRLDDIEFRLERRERGLLERLRRRWEMAAAAVRHYDARRMLAGIHRELDARVAEIASVMRTTLLRRAGRLDQVSGRLETLSPVAILERGYALVFDAEGKLVKDASRLQAGDEISARLGRGTVDSVVKRTR